MACHYLVVEKQEELSQSTGFGFAEYQDFITQ